MLKKSLQKVSDFRGNRKRGTFKGQLNLHREIDLEIFNRIEGLKPRRLWIPTFRNAMRLFFSLMDGRTDVLQELFPGIVAAIANPPASVEYEKMMQAIAELVNNRPVPVMAEAPRVRPTLDDFDINALDEQPTQPIGVVNIADNFLNSFEGYD